jgi:prevent-host-death family protein
MKTVNIHEAKTQLSLLLRFVLEGEEIIIANRGVPVARLVPISSDKDLRPLGKYEGQIVLADDFDELPEDMLAAFEGEEPENTP